MLQKLIPNHLADIECYPHDLLKCFRAARFTVKVKGGMGHAVALDEAHEIAPSTAAPLRKAHLLTMAPPKITKRKLSQKDKEARETNKYLRRRLQWCNCTGQQFDQAEEQYSLFPHALVDPDGQPHKGVKSNWTDKLKARYSTGPNTPFLHLPPWVPHVAIVDAMFPLNITPPQDNDRLCSPIIQSGYLSTFQSWDIRGSLDTYLIIQTDFPSILKIASTIDVMAQKMNILMLN